MPRETLWACSGCRGKELRDSTARGPFDPPSGWASINIAVTVKPQPQVVNYDLCKECWLSFKDRMFTESLIQVGPELPSFDELRRERANLEAEHEELEEQLAKLKKQEWEVFRLEQQNSARNLSDLERVSAAIDAEEAQG